MRRDTAYRQALDKRMTFACNRGMHLSPVLLPLGKSPRRLLSALCAATVLAGCASGPGSPGNAPGARAPTVSLPAEQRRLAELYRGTPVVFELRSDGALRVAVPLQYAFDKGRAAVKPPLAKVLDSITPSLKDTRLRARVSAPPDTARSPASLAQERAASTRDYLVAKGVSTLSFAALAPLPATADGVEIVIGSAQQIR
jgi:outer membrane protein OmpA-like peptidoglycan-associated protein